MKVFSAYVGLALLGALSRPAHAAASWRVRHVGAFLELATYELHPPLTHLSQHDVPPPMTDLRPMNGTRPTMGTLGYAGQALGIYGRQYDDYFAKLAMGRIGLSRYSPLLIQYWYEIGWGIAMGTLLLLTAMYAVGRRVGEVSKGTKSEMEGVSTGDGETVTLEQKGFTRSFFGTSIFYLWCAVPAIGYLQMIFFTLDYYLFAFHVPDQTWLQLAEPFLMVYFISHFVLFAQGYCLAKARVFFMTQTPLTEATWILVETPGSVSSGVLCPVTVDNSEGGSGRHYFEYTCVRYLWDAQEGRFRPGGVDHVSGAKAKARLQAGGFVEREKKQRGASGPNTISIAVPGFFASVAHEFLSSIYVFQFCCIWIYMFYSTWNIATIWLILAVISGTTKAVLVRKSLLQIQEMAATQTTATVLREGKWKSVGSADIVPGDILSVDMSVVPCDIAVLEGFVVVNESMLTGEPMPVQRFEVGSDNPDKELDAETMKRNFLFAGTLVMQSGGGTTAGGGAGAGRALGVAVSTGARTAKGSMVRMVLFPAPIQFKFTDQLAKVYIIMATYAFALFLTMFFKDQGHILIALFTGICILTQSLQPNMPVSFTLAQSIASHRLKAQCGVLCLSPARIPVAGKVQAFVFDKTGTITKDGMDFAGVHPMDPSGGKSFLDFAPLGDPANHARWARNIPQPLIWATASCHTVTKLDNGDLVGNAVECAMLKTSGWELSQNGRTVREVGGAGEVIEFVRRLDFDHHRMTSGAVIRIPSQNRTVALIKGSYERIGELVSSRSPLPQDYDTVTKQHAADQYYVLGVGIKELPQYSPDMTRDQIEQDLGLLGLLLFRNEMKPDSPEALAELTSGGVRCIMCTGDNALTGVAIGKRCTMISNRSTVIIGDIEGATGLQWRLYPENTAVQHSTVMQADANDVELVLTKPAFKHLVHSNEIDTILDKVRVYARMKPDDKVKVIHLHQDRGWVVGMVGDGGNDCGALRAAHVGLALSEAEASIVAPFSSGAEHGTGSKSLKAVGDLLRYGRSTLATQLATYMYFMVYAVCVPTSKLAVVFMGNMMLSEWTWVFIDIIVGSAMVAAMTFAWPTAKVAQLRPTSSLLGARTIITVLMPVIVFTLFFTTGILLLRQQEFYVAYDAIELGVPAHEWQKKSDNFECAVVFFLMGLQLATATFVFSYGAEYRRMVCWNWVLNILYLGVLVLMFCLLWGGPGELSCTFRVNCDSATSQSMYVPGIQEFSTGNLGGCFLGPQLLSYREKLGDKYENPDFESNGCNPSADLDMKKEIQRPSGAIGALGNPVCYGPNNCFDYHFRMVMTWLMVGMTVITHVLAKALAWWHPAPKKHFKKL